MRSIKGSLAGLVLAGILAITPAGAFAHGFGGEEEAILELAAAATFLVAPTSGAAAILAGLPVIVSRLTKAASLGPTFSMVGSFSSEVPMVTEIPMNTIIRTTVTTTITMGTITMTKGRVIW